MKLPMAVVGAGNGGQCMAADLALAGYEVVLYEHPRFADKLRPVLDSGRIVLEGVGREGVAELALVTVDASEALRRAKVINVVMPAYGHDLFFREMIPHLRDDHIVVVWSGDFGSLRLRHMLAEGGFPVRPLIVETNTLPYGTRLIEVGRVALLLTAPKVAAAALPATRTEEALAALRPMWPCLFPVANVLVAALSNPNPICHPPGSLLNVGRIQYSRGNFYMYREGITEAVARVIRKVWEETDALARSLGLVVLQYEDRDFRTTCSIMGVAFQAPFDTVGVIASVIGPKSIRDRYITEDLPYGLVPMSQLGKKLGVATPTIDALINIGCVVCQEDFWQTGRTLEQLGLADLDRQQILQLVEQG